MVKKPLADHAEINFRMNLLRYHLKVDFSPTEDAIMAIHRAYLAEFEQLGYKRQKPDSGGGGNQGAPRVRAVELPQ